MLCSINIVNPSYILQNGKFPESVRLMTGIQWLKLNETNLTEIPEEMGKLLKLVIYCLNAEELKTELI